MATSRRFDDLPMYADDVDIARAVLGSGHTDEWKAISVILEREGLPPRDPLMGGRYWPGVQAWFAKRPAPAAPIISLTAPGRWATLSSDKEGSDRAPGLSWRPRKDGKAAYWVAREDLVRKGFKPSTVRIHFDPADPFHPAKIAAKCRVLQAEMLTWQRDGGAPRAAAFDGTFRSLIRIYETERSSPFHDLKERSQGFYLYGLRLLDQTIGTARVDAVSGVELRRLYQDLRVPAPLTKKQRKAGDTKAPDRARRAYTAIQMLRVVVNYGRTLKLDACDVLGDILSKMEFQGVRRRENRITHEQVCAFRKAAHEEGRPSMALGITLQFDLGMRQRDVIGEWLPDASPGAEGIVDHGLRWSDGLAFSHISGTVLRKKTSKTGKVVEHDLAQLPDTLSELERIPASRRIGPLVLNEETGLPYKRRVYVKWFRTIARKAGIPDDVWSMDARAGAVTEALDAGAQPNDVMNAAGHTQLSTTQGYDRGMLKKTARVAQLRVASRKKKDSEGEAGQSA
ncbi:hypothetical protein [Xanthobacter autotrophicus]|uniref:hypothetical protein n=1 Tax=Xanthobacter autotrophicus TaxID=280 RepID=UPI00372953F2